VAPLAEQPEPSITPAPDARGPDIWRYVSAGLAAGWLLTALLWWRSVSSSVAGRTRRIRANPRWRENRRLIKELRYACGKNDALGAHSALMQWAKLRFPEDAPNSLGALAERMPEDAARAIAELEASLYGQGEKRWAGQDLRAAFGRLEAVAESGTSKRADALLPLYR
jgi:hypothetical protein